mmetsp:Transcript_5836/g.24361  ORF Transcript_5836/g.24361 Transcript_5836/m.24361 type:complete len:324 (+) Transcript_5836:843-1814(+)
MGLRDVGRRGGVRLRRGPAQAARSARRRLRERVDPPVGGRRRSQPRVVRGGRDSQLRHGLRRRRRRAGHVETPHRAELLVRRRLRARPLVSRRLRPRLARGCRHEGSPPPPPTGRRRRRARAPQEQPPLAAASPPQVRARLGRHGAVVLRSAQTPRRQGRPARQDDCASRPARARLREAPGPAAPGHRALAELDGPPAARAAHAQGVRPRQDQVALGLRARATPHPRRLRGGLLDGRAQVHAHQASLPRTTAPPARPAEHEEGRAARDDAGCCCCCGRAGLWWCRRRRRRRRPGAPSSSSSSEAAFCCCPPVVRMRGSISMCV